MSNICAIWGFLITNKSSFSREVGGSVPAGSYTHVQEYICGKMGLGNTIFFSKLVEGSKVRDDISVRILLVTSERKHEFKHLN